MTDNDLDLADKLRKNKIAGRDGAHLDPAERAEQLVSLICDHFKITEPSEIVKNPLYWDLVCFSVEMLGAFAISSQDGELMELAKLASLKIYSMHYSVPDEHEILGPSREEHVAFWLRDRGEEWDTTKLDSDISALTLVTDDEEKGE